MKKTMNKTNSHHKSLHNDRLQSTSVLMHRRD